MPFDIEAGTLEVSIEDLDRRFNLNSLAGEGSCEEHRALQDAARCAGHRPRRWPMRGAIGSTRDGEATGFGAEDGAYLVATPPFRTANQPAGSTSEVALLSLLDADQLARLLPYVTTLPTTDTQDQREHGERADIGIAVVARVADAKSKRWYNPIATTTIPACCWRKFQS